MVGGADVFSGRPCVQAWPEGSLPTMHREQLNTTRAAVHGWKQAEKICVTHAQAALKDRADGEKYSATGKSCTESREQK